MGSRHLGLVLIGLLSTAGGLLVAGLAVSSVNYGLSGLTRLFAVILVSGLFVVGGIGILTGKLWARNFLLVANVIAAVFSILAIAATVTEIPESVWAKVERRDVIIQFSGVFLMNIASFVYLVRLRTRERLRK